VLRRFNRRHVCLSDSQNLGVAILNETHRGTSYDTPIATPARAGCVPCRRRRTRGNQVNLQLTSKRALVTGSSRGIGAGIARVAAEGTPSDPGPWIV
jgi:hypothetical protein